MGLIVLLSGHAASSQGFAGDAGVRALSRGLATTTSSTTSTTNTCPDEAQACLNDTSCAGCFQKPESTSCVNGFLLGDDLTCEDVFSGFFCCQWGDEDSCVDNALLRDVFGERPLAECGTAVLALVQTYLGEFFFLGRLKGDSARRKGKTTSEVSEKSMMTKRSKAIHPRRVNPPPPFVPHTL